MLPSRYGVLARHSPFGPVMLVQRPPGETHSGARGSLAAHSRLLLQPGTQRECSQRRTGPSIERQSVSSLHCITSKFDSRVQLVDIKGPSNMNHCPSRKAMPRARYLTSSNGGPVRLPPVGPPCNRWESLIATRQDGGSTPASSGVARRQHSREHRLDLRLSRTFQEKANALALTVGEAKRAGKRAQVFIDEQACVVAAKARLWCVDGREIGWAKLANSSGEEASASKRRIWNVAASQGVGVVDEVVDPGHCLLGTQRLCQLGRGAGAHLRVEVRRCRAVQCLVRVRCGTGAPGRQKSVALGSLRGGLVGPFHRWAGRFVARRCRRLGAFRAVMCRGCGGLPVRPAPLERGKQNCCQQGTAHQPR